MKTQGEQVDCMDCIIFIHNFIVNKQVGFMCHQQTLGMVKMLPTNYMIIF